MAHSVLLSSTLVLALGVLGACSINAGPSPTPVSDTTPDRTITCEHFATFQYDCTATCSSTWDCEANYDSLDVIDQITLDDCSDCLAANDAGGSCADCSDPYVGSCRQFMEDLLGVSCF